MKNVLAQSNVAKASRAAFIRLFSRAALGAILAAGALPGCGSQTSTGVDRKGDGSHSPIVDGLPGTDGECGCNDDVDDGDTEGTGASNGSGSNGGGGNGAGGNGAGGNGAGSSGAGASGPGASCKSDADCETELICSISLCVAGYCVLDDLPAGTSAGDALLGDCHHDVCDGAGKILSAVDNLDIPQVLDGTCEIVQCLAGAVISVPKLAGTACDGGTCNGSGDCIECSLGSDCDSGVCEAGLCQAPSCDDNVQNGDESDADCGGSCGACSAGKACTCAADCLLEVCIIAPGLKIGVCL